MRRPTRIAVALMLGMVACAEAACGLDTFGLAASADDGGPTSGTDATTDDGAGTSDGAGGDGPVDVVGANDAQNVDAASPQDAASESPPPTCTACGATSCCNSGTCATIADQTCGDPGQPCNDCTTSSLGSKCIALAGHQVCGCSGPASPDECPANMACHNQQCASACDGQHGCNGGCCSGNDLASSTCVTACPGGTMCVGNYCQ